MRIITAEICGADVDRHIGGRQIRRQFVLDLLLAVGAVQVFEIAPRIISGAVFQLDV